MNILINELKAEHKEILHLIRSNAISDSISDKVVDYLHTHIMKENDVFYPKLKEISKTNQEVLRYRNEIDKFIMFSKNALDVLQNSKSKYEIKVLYEIIRKRIKFEEEVLFKML